MAYNPAKGPLQPEKYKGLPLGPNYYKYGEQPGFIYDPYSDKYKRDPKAAKEYYQSQGLMEPDPKTPSLTSTLLPIAGTAGAIYGAQALAPELVGAWGKSGEAGTGLLGLGKDALGFGGAGASKALGAGTQGATSAATGSVPAPEILGASKVTAPAATEGGGLLSLGGIGSAGNAILPIAGAFGAYDVLSNDVGPVRGGLEGAASGAAIGSYFGPAGAGIGAGIGGLVGLGKSLLDKPSTRDIAKSHTKQLLGQSTDDPAWQSYVSAIREQYNAPPPDPSKPFHGGQYGTWNEYKEAGLDPNDLTGVYGNLKTFGNEWTKLNFDQQKAVTQGIIDAGLYDSKKGEVIITDPKKAQEIKNQVLGKK